MDIGNGDTLFKKMKWVKEKTTYTCGNSKVRDVEIDKDQTVEQLADIDALRFRCAIIVKKYKDQHDFLKKVYCQPNPITEYQCHSIIRIYKYLKDKRVSEC